MADDAPAPKDTKSSGTTTKLQTILSRLDHPVTLLYGDETIQLPPRGSIPNLDASQLKNPDGTAWTKVRGTFLVDNTGRG